MGIATQLDDATASVVPYAPETNRLAGDVVQLADGRAGVLVADTVAGASGFAWVSGRVAMPKNSTPWLLDGNRAYWDRSANQADYKKVGDRDFYLGRVVGDSISGVILAVVRLNADPRYDVELALDPFDTAIVKTAGSPLLNRRGGAHELLLDSTNEAQKVDALSRDTFSKDANAIVEGAFVVVNGGAAGAPDFNVGIADATHATDADSIARHVFLHLDGNSVNVYAQSKDGTTTVTAADTTVDYTAGSAIANRVEFWLDCRNPASVAVYVNGARVLSGTTFRIDNAAAEFKLLAHLEKTAAADQFDVFVEWLRVRFAER